MRAILYINIFCTFFWLSHGVAANDNTGPDDADSRARMAYQRGTELFAAEQYVAAAESFREANRQKTSWKIQYNIAQAESAAKRYGLALQAFELFLAEGGDEIGVTRKDEVLAEIRRLREMVASVDVEGPPSAEVYVDGVKRGAIPLEGLIKITAGKRHEIKVVMDGEVLLSRKIRLSGGDETTIRAMEKETVADTQPVVATTPEEPEEEPAVSEPEMPVPEEQTAIEETGEPVDDSVTPTTESEGGGKKLRTAGAVMLGIGGAVAIFGGVMGGISMAQTRDVKDLCDNANNECNTTDGQNAYDKAMGFGAAANILIPVGAAVAGTGLVLYLIGRKKREKLTSPQVIPIVENAGGAIMVTGKF